MSLAFRPAQSSDTWWVVSTWCDTFKAAPEAGLIQIGDWYDVMKAQVLKLLAFDSVSVLVATNPDNDDPKSRDYGWIATERAPDIAHPILLYAYVKEPVRRMGLGDRLIKEAGLDGKTIWYAARTRDGEHWLRGRDAEWKPRAATRRRQSRNRGSRRVFRPHSADPDSGKAERVINHERVA